SYSLGVIAEEMANLPKDVNENMAVLILDTMGIFWSMKYPNQRQSELLKHWGLSPKGLDVEVYTPKGKFEEYRKKKVPTDQSFSVKPNELNASDWCDVFNVEITSPIGVLIERMINKIKGDYSISDIIKEIKKDKKGVLNIKQALENRFLAADSWGLFDVKGTKIKDIVKGGQVSILDISCYTDWNIKCLVVSILSKKLLRERVDARKSEEMDMIKKGQHYFDFGDEKKLKMPLVWMMIDEAHEFLPKEGKTPATDALVFLLREGRQPGISLVLATQQPGQIHRDVFTQSDIIVSHRVTAELDVKALNSIMETYLTEDILSYLNNLPRLKGSAIILDDNSERIYPMRVRPKMSWHGGDTPSSVRIKKGLLDLKL
ncbi:ATP-binding protein, partial [archaeon]|nr:ATP-binding protein [archaeon]